MALSKHPLAHLLASIIDDQEQGGARASRLLHDEVGQILSAVGLHLDVLRMDTEEDSPAGATRIIDIQKFLEQAVEQVRTLSYDLNPAIVERAGLKAALNRLVARYREISDTSVRLAYDSSVHMPAAAAVALFKIAERALDNAVKHADAQLIEVLVHPNPQGVTLQVRDDGEGFDLDEVAENPPGLGLLLMQCYADRGSLRVEVNTSPGNGTIVKARFIATVAS